MLIDPNCACALRSATRSSSAAVYVRSHASTPVSDSTSKPSARVTARSEQQRAAVLDPQRTVVVGFDGDETASAAAPAPATPRRVGGAHWYFTPPKRR